MKKLIKLLKILFLFSIITIPLTSSATCMIPNGFNDSANRYINSDNVFIAEVIYVDSVDDTTLISVNVLKNYKGQYEKNDKMTLLTPVNINDVEKTILDCGYTDLKIGSIYSFYTDRGLNTYTFSGNERFTNMYEAVKRMNTIAISSGQDIYSEKNNVLISDSCKVWYDGCNTCSRAEIGGDQQCTTRECSQNEIGAAYCQITFNEVNENEQSNNVVGDNQSINKDNNVNNNQEKTSQQKEVKKEIKKENLFEFKKIEYKYEKNILNESDRVDIVNINKNFESREHNNNKIIINKNYNDKISDKTNKNSWVLIVMSMSLILLVSILLYIKSLYIKQEEGKKIKNQNKKLLNKQIKKW